MHEKELDDRKIMAGKKLKCKEHRHEEIIAIEREKCKLLRKFLNDKENVAQSSDSDNN